MTTPTLHPPKLLTNAPRSERPRHSHQPDDRLVPATVEMDDVGNVLFSYTEPTPEKPSPQIVPPQSLLKRLTMKSIVKRNSLRSINNKSSSESLTNRRAELEHPQVVSLHESLLLDEPLSSCDDLDEDNYSVQSSASSLTGSLTSSVASIARMKLRLRRNRKKKIKKETTERSSNLAILSPLKETELNTSREDEKYPQKKKQNVFRRSFVRRSSNTSSTRSTSSRASSLLDMDVPGPSARPRMARVLVKALVEAPYESKESMTSKSNSNSEQEKKGMSPVRVKVLTPPVPVAVEMTPPPIATLKAAMDAMDAMRSAPQVEKQEEKQLDPVATKTLTAVAEVPATTPPPTATLKAAMETAKEQSERCSSKTPVASTSSEKSPPSQASPLIVQQQQPSPPENHESSAKSSPAHQATVLDPLTVTTNSASDATLAVANPLPQDSNFKIFLLLLHPTSKIFELIQLFFNPATTTVRDVIYMIPTNATEAALGAQDYYGLCRPNSNDEEKEEEISDMELFIQNHDNVKGSAQIVRGEILVAIPEGYTAKEVANLSQQILQNPRIRRLLESDDPLAPKPKKRSSRKENKRRRRSRKLFEVLEKHDEDKPTEDLSDSVQVAMKKAQKAAAVANAAILELPRNRSLVTAVGKTYRYSIDRHGKVDTTSPQGMSLETALRDLDTSSASASFADVSERSFSNSIDPSEYMMDKSFSSWSKSLDRSYAAGGGIMRNATKLDTPSSLASSNQGPMISTPRRNKQMKFLRQVAVGVAALMCTSYGLDPNGFAVRHSRPERMLKEPMGLAGLIQVTFVFLILCKLQFLCSLPTLQSPTSLNMKSRCPFMKSRESFLECGVQGKQKNKRLV